MAIERRERGGKVFYVARPKRGKVRSKSFDTRKEAKAYEGSVLAGDSDPSEMLVRDFIDLWLREYTVVKSGPTRGERKKQSTLDDYRSDLRPVREAIGDLPLGRVRRKHATALARAHPRAATIARAMFADAYDDELIPGNPFSRLGIAKAEGRKNHSPLTVGEVYGLGATARAFHGPEWGPVCEAHILFSAFTGIRQNEGYHLEWRDVQPDRDRVFVREAKFGKAGATYMPPEAYEAIKGLPRQDHGFVFFSKRAGKLLNKSAHYRLWRDPFDVFFSNLSDDRREQVTDLDWHSLRHFTGYYFYVVLGHSSRLAARQLRHSDPRLVETLYGHFKEGALEELIAAGSKPKLREIRRSA